MIRIAFIGSGNMAEAIIGGILDAGLFNKDEILASDISLEKLASFRAKWDLHTTQNNPKDLSVAPIVVLAVKPQNLDEMLAQLAGVFQQDTLLISILAGVSLQKIAVQMKKYTQFHSFPMARVMPNLGAFVRKSVSAISFNSFVSEKQKTLVSQIFDSIGWTHVCDESLLNTVTAVSGSGPAYVFYFLEAFMEAAEHLGFSKSEASDYCLETLSGAQNLLLKRENTPEELRSKVTSKGGTTEAAIRSLEDSQFKPMILKALQAAKNRAVELGT